ncbi:Hsp20/alpha crystallin family protein [Roseivirga echinicomitans]
MNLVKRNPEWFGPASVDAFFDRFFNDSLQEQKNGFSPKVDIAETASAFEIQVAVPGFSKSDFSIDLKDGKLSISGERKLEKENKEKNFISIQTEYGRFFKSFQLPENINEKGIEATYENGILALSIPKDETKKVESKIAVK